MIPTNLTGMILYRRPTELPNRREPTMHATVSSIIARLDSNVYLDRSDALFDIEAGARHIKAADRAVIVGRLVGLRERAIEEAISRGCPSRAAAEDRDLSVLRIDEVIDTLC